MNISPRLFLASQFAYGLEIAKPEMTREEIITESLRRAQLLLDADKQLTQVEKKTKTKRKTSDLLV